MRILLAEDEKALSKAIFKIFEKNNYSVDAVYNGEDALSYLELGSYGAAVLDIMMPGMDGITVLKKIRAEGNPHPAPPSREDSSHMISAIPARCARLRRCIRSAHPSFPHPTTRAVSATTA